MRSRALLLVLLFVSGCGRPPPPTVDETDLRLRRIVQAYDFYSQKKGQPPKKLQDLQPFLLELGEKREPGELAVSPRDGQAFVIRFGAPLDALDRKTILAYEKQGIEGVRYVLTVSREIRKIPDSEFRARPFALDHSPP